MPQNPSHGGSFSYKDFSGEPSSFSFHMGAVTALTIADILAQIGDLRDALADITLGTLYKDEWYGDRTRYSVLNPTDVNAQRERKFLVTYEDSVTFSIYTSEIPTADFTGRMVDDTDQVDLVDTEIAAFITAFETLCVSPDGNAVTVVAITGVGRNL